MDITLTYALYSMVLLAFAVALGIAWAQTGRRGYLGRWALFSLFYFVGTAVNLTPNVQSYPLLIGISYTCFFGSYHFLIRATATYAFGPEHSRRAARVGDIIGIAGLGATLSATVVVDAFRVRYAAFNIWSAAVFIQVAVILFLEFGGRRSESSGARNWFSLITAAFTSLAWIARTATGLIFEPTSSQFGDPASIAATAAVAFSQLLFTASLFNLAERRVADQLASLRTASVSATGLQSASDLVTGIAHALGSPLGSAVTVFSAIRAHLEQQHGEDRVDLTALDMVETELNRAVSRLRGLRLLFQDSGEHSGRELLSSRQLGATLQQALDSVGIKAELAECAGEASPPDLLLDGSRAVQLILEFIELARRSDWLAPHAGIRLLPGCGDGEHFLRLAPLPIPDEIWRNLEDPLQRPGVKHFADTLALAMLRQQLADTLGLAMQVHDGSPSVVSLTRVE